MFDRDVPDKRAVVIHSLSGFHGPVRGRVRLPHRMFWHADRVFDLDKPAALRRMYEIVLREALSYDELRTWLDVPTLRREWHSLSLPQAVRRDWERRHPSLAGQLPSTRSV